MDSNTRDSDRIDAAELLANALVRMKADTEAFGKVSTTAGWLHGYAECQADVMAHGKHGEFLSVRDFLAAISLDEHVGATERAKGGRT